MCDVFLELILCNDDVSWGTLLFIPKEKSICEPTCGWMVRGTVLSPAHQGSSPVARIIPGFILGFSAIRFQWEETFPSTTRRLR